MGRAAQRRTEQQITGATEAQLQEQRAFQDRQRQVLDAQRAQFENFEFTNPFAGMENTMEDLQVNTAAADFQAEQGRQQRVKANICRFSKTTINESKTCCSARYATTTIRKTRRCSRSTSFS